MRKAALLIAIGLMALLATGCWDVKTIQDINYIVSLGFDYKNGKYLIYAQLLDFSNVAKQEGGVGRQPAPVWVGRGEGASVALAMDSLYQTSQQHVFWGHVSTFVFTESVLRRGLEDDVIDTIIRFREMRYTQWVYGTKQPIEKIFTTKPFFNLSPLSSILTQPMSNYEQDSYMRPVKLHRLIADLREPGKTVRIPTLGIETDSWKRNGLADPKLRMDGMFAVTRGKEVVWLDRSGLAGLRWLTTSTNRSMLSLSLDGQATVQLILERPEYRPQVRMEGGSLVLDLDVRIHGRIAEEKVSAGMEDIREEAVRRVAEQVKGTFQYAMERDIDLLQAEHLLYRTRFGDWRNATDSGEHPVRPIRLGDVQVRIFITDSGMYKNRQVERGY